MILKTKRTIQWLLGAFFALFLLSGCGMQAENVEKAAEAKADDLTANMDKEGIEGMAPPFTATAMDGSAVTINAAMDKKIYVINFWATWCPPCRAEMPELEDFAREHADEVTFYAVNIQEPKDAVEKFLKEHKYTMPILLDLKGDAAEIYHIRAVPTTYIIDQTGKIQYKKIGSTTAAELETALLHAKGQ